MSGIPGSGKSYHSLKLVRESPTTTVVVSTDAIREEMGYTISGENWDNKREKRMWSILINRVIEFSDAYKTVIVDCTAVTNKRRKWMYDHFNKLFDNFELHIIDCPLNKAIEQDGLRERHVPHSAIARMSYIFEQPDDFVETHFKIIRI